MTTTLICSIREAAIFVIVNVDEVAPEIVPPLFKSVPPFFHY
jgi:hypothetical protein